MAKNREDRRKMAKYTRSNCVVLRHLRTADVPVHVAHGGPPVMVKATLVLPRGTHAPDDTRALWVAPGDQIAASECAAAGARVQKLAEMVLGVAQSALRTQGCVGEGELANVESMAVQILRPDGPLACLVVARFKEGAARDGRPMPDVWVHVPIELAKPITPCGKCDPCRRNLVRFVVEPD